MSYIHSSALPSKRKFGGNRRGSNPGPKYRVDIKSGGLDEVDGLPADLPYTKLDIIITLTTIVCFYIDIGTDIALAFTYLNRTRYAWFGLTLAFIIVPSVANSILNLYFYWLDYQKEQEIKMKDTSTRSSAQLWILRVLFTVFQMGPVIRNFESLRYGLKSKSAATAEQRRYYYQWMVREDADACMLRLFESFMESAPQLTLQLYILVVDTTHVTDPLRIVSVLISWFSVSWSLASYHRALRYGQEDKSNLGWCATVTYFLCRIFEVGPRIIIIAMFITQYHYWIVIPLAVHWVFMFAWLQVQRLTFCENALWQMMFNGMCAFVSLFCFLNVKEGTSRYRCALFYAIFYTENVVLFSLWLRFSDHMGAWFHLAALIFIPCSIVMHGFLFISYYCCCHPNREDLIVCKPYNSSEMFASLCFKWPEPTAAATGKYSDTSPPEGDGYHQHYSEPEKRSGRIASIGAITNSTYAASSSVSYSSSAAALAADGAAGAYFDHSGGNNKGRQGRKQGYVRRHHHHHHHHHHNNSSDADDDRSRTGSHNNVSMVSLSERSLHTARSGHSLDSGGGGGGGGGGGSGSYPASLSASVHTIDSRKTETNV